MIAIRPQYVRALTLIAFMCVLWSSAGSAAPLPREFQGIWMIELGEETQCKKSDWGENDGLISVKPNAIEQWESRCDFKKIGSPSTNAVEATATCSGEGMTWREQQILSIQKLGSQKYFIYVVVKEFDHREEGKRIKGESPSAPNVRVYRECK